MKNNYDNLDNFFEELKKISPAIYNYCESKLEMNQNEHAACNQLIKNKIYKNILMGFIDFFDPDNEALEIYYYTVHFDKYEKLMDNIKRNKEYYEFQML